MCDVSLTSRLCCVPKIFFLYLLLAQASLIVVVVCGRQGRGLWDGMAGSNRELQSARPASRPNPGPSHRPGGFWGQMAERSSGAPQTVVEAEARSGEAGILSSSGEPALASSYQYETDYSDYPEYGAEYQDYPAYYEAERPSRRAQVNRRQDSAGLEEEELLGLGPGSSSGVNTLAVLDMINNLQLEIKVGEKIGSKSFLNYIYHNLGDK